MYNSTFRYLYEKEKKALRNEGYPLDFGKWMASNSSSIGDIFETAVLYMWAQDQPEGIASLVTYAWQASETYHGDEGFQAKITALKEFRPNSELRAGGSGLAEASGSVSSGLGGGEVPPPSAGAEAATPAGATPSAPSIRQPQEPGPSWLKVAQQAGELLQATGFDASEDFTLSKTALYTCTTRCPYAKAAERDIFNHWTHRAS